MRKILIFSMALFLALSFSCSRPEKSKAPAQQKIETPEIQLSGQPTTLTPAEVTALKSQSTQEQKSPDKPSQTQTVQANPTLLKNNTNIEIIIDATGSMNGLIGQTTKIGAVRTALKNILGTVLPPEMANRKIAIRVYGNKSTSDKNDCTDTQLLSPMSKDTSSNIAAIMDTVQPKGTSPLAFALENSYDDFKENADTSDNLIVLIADGLDSCGGDIFAAADRLRKGGAKVIIDVIGFDVDQQTQDQLKKLAEGTDGHFFLARSDSELYTMLDQALSTTLPYNLRVKALSGATPVPSTMTIYRANTQAIVDRADTQGIKFFKLRPGSYDILVEYSASIEAVKPSKMIKGVEVTDSAKAEQIVQFEIGSINLSATDQDGKITPANFYFRKSGTDQIVVKLTNVMPPQTLFLTPGSYDIDAESTGADIAALTSQLKNVNVAAGETTEAVLKFQTGKLALRAETTDKKAVPIKYRVVKTGTDDEVLSGEGTPEGIIMDLPPGTYDVNVTWVSPNITGGPGAKLSSVTISGGETLEQVATISTGTLKLSGKDPSGKYVHTEFTIKKPDAKEGDAIQFTSEGEPQDIAVEPGTYDITAVNSNSKIIPPPSVDFNAISVKEGQSQTVEALFQIGILKVIGKNSKNQEIPTIFSIFRSGLDDPIVTENSDRAWIEFSLTPGLYDIKAEDATVKTESKPVTWLHDVEIKNNEVVAKEALFTSGKLKLICRGKNNVMLECEFDVFAYGTDTALFSGSTSEDWKIFDIPPGDYYLSAGWHDPEEEVLLKKWININIEQNQILEKVIRF